VISFPFLFGGVGKPFSEVAFRRIYVVKQCRAWVGRLKVHKEKYDGNR
jgi:hypothetical protein